MLMASLMNQTSYDVRFAAVKAAVNFLLLHDKDTNIQKSFTEMLGPILNVSLVVTCGSNSSLNLAFADYPRIR